MNRPDLTEFTDEQLFDLLSEALDELKDRAGKEAEKPAAEKRPANWADAIRPKQA